MLENVDADEVSPVDRPANRRRFILKADGADPGDVDAQVSDIMRVPWENEGAMLDALRAAGADEVVQKSAVTGMRLLNGVLDELPGAAREAVEKLGTQMYSSRNPELNSGSAADVPGHDGELFATHGAAGGDFGGAASPGGLDGTGRDGELKGTSSGMRLNKADPEGYGYISKKDYSDADRRTMAEHGQALPDGSYPIKDLEDLSDAIHAIGRGKNNPKSKIKAHIMARAKALGASDKIPDSWNDNAVAKAYRALGAAILGKSQDTRGGSPDDPEDEDEDDEDDDEPDGDPDDTTIAKGGTVDTHAVPIQKADGTWDLDGVPAETRPFYESVLKRQSDTEAELAEAREQIKKADDTIRENALIAKAEAEFQSFGPAEEIAPILKEAQETMSPEAYEKLEGILAVGAERISKGDLFAEKGRSALGDGAKSTDSWAKIEKAAAEVVEKSTDVTQEQAVARVLQTAEGAELYSQHLRETGLGVS